MTEQMRRPAIIGDAPSARIRATGLGTSRNGLPGVKPYVHPGWVNGVPSPADNPADTARAEKIRATVARKRHAAALAAEGRCPDCTYPLGSYGHSVACEDGS